MLQLVKMNRTTYANVSYTFTILRILPSSDRNFKESIHENSSSHITVYPASLHFVVFSALFLLELYTSFDLDNFVLFFSSAPWILKFWLLLAGSLAPSSWLRPLPWWFRRIEVLRIRQALHVSSRHLLIFLFIAYSFCRNSYNTRTKHHSNQWVFRDLNIDYHSIDAK